LPEDGREQPSLAQVRRFEAAGFRAWPAASVEYDGAWLVRLTSGLPAKRLNSVNPLDPKYRLKIALWKKLPLPLANRIGPHIARGLG